jgi:hypothetical protein
MEAPTSFTNFTSSDHLQSYTLCHLLSTMTSNLNDDDDESTIFDFSVPSPVASSSCSSSGSTGSSGGGIADDEESSAASVFASGSFVSNTLNTFDDDETTLNSLSIFQHDDNDVDPSSLLRNKPFTTSSKSTTSTKFSLGLDNLRRVARLGRNASIKDKCQLPPNISKTDIYVQVDIDEGATSSRKCGKLDEVIKEAIHDDLSAVYSADSKSAKLFLCVVIVVMTDGSFLRTLSDRDGVIGLAEIGLVWRLFDADDLTVFNGGLVVKTKEVATGLFDLMIIPNRGRQCLLNRLVPRVANDIMSRIADKNDELLVEI